MALGNSALGTVGLGVCTAPEEQIAALTGWVLCEATTKAIIAEFEDM